MTVPAIPVDPPVTRLPLSAEQASWYQRILAEVSRDRLQEIVVEMTSIASPTGQERALAERLVARGRQAGLEGTCQMLDEAQANALLRHPGRGDGADLLLYAPIDTHTTGAEADDVPWVGARLREDMVPRATVHGDYVVGLGANNPKGHAACVLAAAEAACRAGAPLRGALLAGFGSGGMPVDPRPGAARRDVGHGRGCAFMLERGFRGDFAVIAKTGWAVAWEEVGLAWLRVRVHGALNYAGIRHFVRYENPIVRAATVIGELERWFPEYTKANTSGLVAPQGSIGAIEGGWTHKPTFVPAACDLYIDLRLSPRTSVPDARRQFEAAIADIRRRHPEIPLTWELRGRRARHPHRSGQLDRPVVHARLGGRGGAAARPPGQPERGHRRQHPASPRHPDGPRRHGPGTRRRAHARRLLEGHERRLPSRDGAADPLPRLCDRGHVPALAP